TFQSDQAFGTLASRLVDRGLIVRAAGQGRRIEHTLTPSGRAALDDGHRVASDVLPQLFSPLDEEQRDLLLRALLVLTADA
ncbi:MAG: MarR family transcriptional regulator, partial [Actinobacteria bacterium]|nr:MarR family transcriptional regulator [Actinomycetota bacterium]